MLLFFCKLDFMVKKFFEDIYILFRLINQQVKQGEEELKILEYDNHEDIYLNKYKFSEFKRENLCYPENTNPKNRFLELNVEFVINKNNQAKNIKLSTLNLYMSRHFYPNIQFKKTKNIEYFDVSKQIIKNYNYWVPYRKDKEYVEGKVLIKIEFLYHKDYFDYTKEFCLNPEKKASYKDKKNDLYQRLINCKYNCDGVINLICIVEKDGKLTNIEFISSEGKGIQEWAIKGLNELGSWEAATNKGKPVRSQMQLSIYT